MEKINIAIVGYGNVGKGVEYAIKNNEDMKLSAVITRRDPSKLAISTGFISPIDNDVPLNQMEDKLKEDNVEVISYDDTKKLKQMKRGKFLRFLTGYKGPSIDVAILCGGSKKDLPEQGPYFAKLFNTVDSFDTHANIPEYFEKMNKISKKYGNVSVISAGWDPGTFSLERTLLNALIPGAEVNAFYGLNKKGGLSMGHSDAIRTIKGVKDARQYTHAIIKSIDKIRRGKNPKLTDREKHWRECIVVAEKGADKKEIEKTIINMENYFKPYKTTVKFVSQKKLDTKYKGMPHDGLVIAVGKTGKNNRAMIEYKNEWESNPEATGNILIAHARAANRLNKEGKKGACTILDIPPSYLSIHSEETLLNKFM